MKASEEQTFMKDLANDAVTFAESEFDIVLDFSRDSVLQVDDVIKKLRNHFRSDIAQEKVVYTLSNILGAYCGECFTKQYGGAWLIEDDGEKNMIYLKKDDFTFPFPGVVYLNLTEKECLSINDYYQEAAQKLEG